MHERNGNSAVRLVFTGFCTVMNSISNSYYVGSGFSLIFLLQQHNFCILILPIIGGCWQRLSAEM